MIVVYNPDVKEQYFNEMFPATEDMPKPTQYKLAVRQSYLEECEPWENKYGVDLGDMTEDQVLDMLNHVGDLSYMRSMDRTQKLHSYIRWYAKKKNHYPTIVDWRCVDLTDTFRETMVGNADRIITDWEQKYPCEDGWMIIPLYLLLWYGMEMQEIVDLKKEDVEILTDVVNIKRKAVKRGSNILTLPGRNIVMCFQKYAGFEYAKGRLRDWIRVDTPYFFTRRIHPDESPKKARMDRVKAYGQLRVARVRKNADDKMPVLYEANRFSTAGFYWRSVQAENAKGEPLTDSEILDLYGSNRDYRNLLEAMRLSIEKYRKAFNL